MTCNRIKPHSILPFIIILLLFYARNISAQDFIMQGWYWNYPVYITGEGNFIQHLSNLGAELKDAGFTYIWAPPLAKGSGGYTSMGYDVKDYYDIGDYGFCRWGTHDEYNAFIANYNALGLKVVSDVIYNHRDGGEWEDNGAVEGWIENMNYTKVSNGDQPYPSDRYRCYLPLGGTSGNNAGNYYFKIHSASQHPNFYGKPYTVIMWTNKIAADFTSPPTIESEPNGGADCGEANTIYTFPKRLEATIDNTGCGTDEFALNISADDFDAAGDTLYISMYNTGAGGLADMSDHFIYGLWSAVAGADIQSQIKYETATDFTNMPSGMGAMNYLNFKPNGSPTQLAGNEDAMLFYYDIDQYAESSKTILTDWTQWQWNNLDVRGFRLDAVKHFPASFVGNLLDDLHYSGINPGIIVGEWFDYNPYILKEWIDNVQSNMDDDTKANINVRAFDFSLRNALEQACDALGYDVRNVFNASMVDGAGASGFNVVTFVNNHDFRDGSQPVSNQPELAYAYILTNNKLGVPCIFYSDYFEPNNLKYKIKGLMEVQKKYIYGATQTDYLNRFGTPYSAEYISGADYTSLIYQMSYAASGREVLTAINFSGNTLKVNQTINTANIFPGDTLTDIFAVTSAPYQIVAADNKVYLEVPPRSFAVWVEGDLTNDTIDISTPVAIQNISPVKELKLYPNPVSNQLVIELPQTVNINAELQIFNAEGNLMMQKNMQAQNNNMQINIETLPAGFYLLKINYDSKIFVGKIIRN